MLISLRKHPYDLIRYLRYGFAVSFVVYVFHDITRYISFHDSRHGQLSNALSSDNLRTKIHDFRTSPAQTKDGHSLSSLGISDDSTNHSFNMFPSGGSPIIQPQEVVLIMKTGYAVYKDRLRSQLKTFASSSHGRDENNTIIIADFTGRTNGWNIKDVIADLGDKDSALTSHEKYKMYQQVTNEIREGVHITPSADPGTNNAGWSLDALKFIPGYKAAAEKFPKAKFFIGIDDDTFVIWDSLMQFLSLLDSTQPLFLGSPAIMLQNNQTFLHGGSIVIISAAAMKTRFIERNTTLELYNTEALRLCCGDGDNSLAQVSMKF